MKYLVDFRKMVDGKYIDLGDFRASDDQADEFMKNIEEYLNYFKNIKSSERRVAEEVLLKMSEFACYQAAVKAKVSAVTVSDPSDKEKKYVHARSVVSFENKKRAWVSIYVPDGKVYFDPKYKSGIDPFVVKKYRSSVMLKLVEKLKSFCRGDD
jgi:hypothetical protein